MELKTFSVEEANSLIPKIRDSLDSMFVIRKKMGFLKMEMDWLHEFWGKNLQDNDNADYDKFKCMEEELEKLHGRMLGKIEKIEGFGCLVKDIDTGLVDFYSIVNGNLAFLCWRYGEREIKYWHEVESGFGSRRPLTQVDRVKNK